MVINCDQFSDIGACRKVNQDRTTAHTSDSVSVMAVADGMGGYSEGEYASSQIIETIDALWTQLCSHNGDIQSAVDIALSSIYKINQQIYQYSKDKGIICGSTLSLLIIMGDSYAAVNIGDSPIYYADRDGLIHISNEHSFGQMKLKSSPFTETIPDPKRDSRLIQAVGVKERLYPYVRTGRLSGTQAFLLCTDGVSKFLASEIIADGLRNVVKGRIMPEELLNSLKNEVYCQGAADNLSAVAAYIKCEASLSPNSRFFCFIVALCIIVMIAFGGIMLALLMNK